MKFLILVPTILVIIASGSCLAGQELTPQLLLDNLKHPSGVAIQPVTGEVFVADSGNGRIVRQDGREATEIIVEFPVTEFELDRSIVYGPLGIAFRDRRTLIVGTGGSDNGEDGIAVYDLEEMVKEPLKAESADPVLKLPATDEYAAVGEFFSMVRTRTALYVTTTGDAENGWIAMADVSLATVENLRRFIATTELTGVRAPGGIIIDPAGRIVAAQMGKRDTAGDSIIAFYSPAGELLDQFPTGLNDIVALAYGPRNKRLFALDFSWEDPAKGGLYKLVAVDTAAGCEARLMAKLDRPTAMAFDGRGNLYVTLSGIRAETFDDAFEEEGVVPDTGQLVVIRNAD